MTVQDDSLDLPSELRGATRAGTLDKPGEMYLGYRRLEPMAESPVYESR